jgi:hypothetical protein
VLIRSFFPLEIMIALISPVLLFLVFFFNSKYNFIWFRFNKFLFNKIKVFSDDHAPFNAPFYKQNSYNVEKQYNISCGSSTGGTTENKRKHLIYRCLRFLFYGV